MQRKSIFNYTLLQILMLLTIKQLHFLDVNWLDTDEQNIRILSSMIDNENVNDALYDFLIKYRLTD